MWRHPFVILLAACSAEQKVDGTSEPGDDDDDTEDPTGCVTDDDCATGEICTIDQCEVGDRDNGPDDATPLPFSDDPAAPEKVEGVIAPPGDVDWYVYTSPGDEWVSIRTETDGGREVLDTVLTVHDPQGDLYAHVDNYPTGILAAPLDSVLYVYLESPGDYTISVEDVTTFYDTVFDASDWRGGTDATYALYLRAAGGTSEPDDVTDPFEVTVPDGNTIVALGVRFETAGDSDWVRIEQPIAGEPMEIWAQPDRPGSRADLLLRLSSTTDGSLLAEKAIGLGGGYVSYFEPAAGLYLLEATTADGQGGAGGWVTLYFRTYDPGDPHPFFGTSVYTYEVEPNEVPLEGTLMNPTDTTLDDGTTYPTWRLEGVLDSDLDVDTFTLYATGDEHLAVRCFTDRFGSLAELQIELLDDAGQVITPVGQGSEPTDDGYLVWNARLEQVGAHHVQVRSETGPWGAGAWYRCAAYGVPFDLDESDL